MPAPDDERLGLLYEVALDQANVAQAAVKDLAAIADQLQQLPAILSAEVSRRLAQSATDAAKPAALIAEEAAREFQTTTQDAAKLAQEASQKAAGAFRRVQWWIFLAVFALGALSGSVGLYALHTPTVENSLDAKAVADYLKPALLDACKRR